MTGPTGVKLKSGDVVSGRYRLLHKLGRGAMGEVWAAESVKKADQRVALKFLRPKLTYDEMVLRRFNREAEIAQRLKSKHIAPFVSAGFHAVDPAAPDGFKLLWIAFELLGGESLATLFPYDTAPRDPVRDASLLRLPDDALRLADELLEGLEVAHAAGIVHRDIKPSNLFIERRPDERGRLRILDFGISKLRERPADASVSKLTHFGAVLGTPHFMAPEQLRDASNVDERADLFAVGVVIFLLLARCLPFPKDSFDAISLLAATGVDGWPPDLGAWLGKLLKANKVHRYRSASAARADLRQIMASVTGDLPRPESCPEWYTRDRTLTMDPDGAGSSLPSSA